MKFVVFYIMLNVIFFFFFLSLMHRVMSKDDNVINYFRFPLSRCRPLKFEG